MYNLIVTGRVGAWDGRGPFEINLDRVAREYTSDALAQKYGALDAAALSELQSFPVLFAYEGGAGDARLGRLKVVQRRGDLVRLEYELAAGFPSIRATEVTRLASELEISRFEMSRTHWAVKSADLMTVLLNARLITRDQAAQLPAGVPSPSVTTPRAPGVPKPSAEPDLVSVALPFDARFTPVYAAIKAACTEAGLRCLRADDVWQERATVQEVLGGLARSRVLVADFSGRNPSVTYETGLAQALGRSVIVLAQSPDDVPVDLRQHVLTYLANPPGLASLQTVLAGRLKALSDQATARR
jgi:hypothetical protein